MSVLTGDIGGTRARLRLYENDRIRAQKTFFSQQYTSLSAIIQQFFLDIGATVMPDMACLAVAGPVIKKNNDQLIKVTNLPWSCSAKHLQKQFSIKTVRLINDLQAAGYALNVVSTKDLSCLQEGRAIPKAPKLLLGLGTGFGQSLLVYHEGKGYIPLASEAGHMDFAPSDDFSWHLSNAAYASLPSNVNSLTLESMLSSRGLLHIYHYCQQSVDSRISFPMGEKLGSTLTPELIIDCANKNDPLALEVVKRYVLLLGAYAGNAALACLPEAGVYIMGGVARAIEPWLKDIAFTKAFTNKVSMSALLQGIPIHLVTQEDIGLLGSYLYSQKKAERAVQEVIV